MLKTNPEAPEAHFVPCISHFLLYYMYPLLSIFQGTQHNQPSWGPCDCTDVPLWQHFTGQPLKPTLVFMTLQTLNRDQAMAEGGLPALENPDVSSVPVTECVPSLSCISSEQEHQLSSVCAQIWARCNTLTVNSAECVVSKDPLKPPQKHQCQLQPGFQFRSCPSKFPLAPLHAPLHHSGHSSAPIQG